METSLNKKELVLSGIGTIVLTILLYIKLSLITLYFRIPFNATYSFGI